MAGRRCKNLEYVIHDRNFIPFKELVSNIGINNSKLLEYQQMKSIVQARFNWNQMSLEIPTQVTEFLNLSSSKLLSKLLLLLSHC